MSKFIRRLTMSKVKKHMSSDIISIDNIKKYILPQYSLEDGEVTMVKFKDTEKQRAVFKIDYKNSSYCLKKVYYDEENLLFVYSAMEWLFRNGVNVPRLLPTINRSRFIIFNNMLFILTVWIDGDKCNFDDINHVQLSSKTLGKLHKTSKSFTAIEGSEIRLGMEDFHLSISKHFNQLLECAKLATNYKDKFSRLFLDNIDYNLELAKLSLEISSSINKKELTTSLCHGDYVNKNIIVDENDAIWLIDFDKCKYDYSMQDLSYFSRRLLRRPNTNWNLTLTTDIIDSYQKENNLTPSDFKYLLAYLAFPQKFWKISRDYYRNIKKCNKNSFITLFEKGLERSESQLKYIHDMIEIFEKHYDIKF